jgi:hypothetical protein
MNKNDNRESNDKGKKVAKGQLYEVQKIHRLFPTLLNPKQAFLPELHKSDTQTARWVNPAQPFDSSFINHTTRYLSQDFGKIWLPL